MDIINKERIVRYLLQLLFTMMCLISVGYSNDFSDETRSFSIPVRPKGVFDGNDVIVRVYLNPKLSPSKHEKYTIKVGEGDRIHFHIYDFPGDSVVAILGKDQENSEIKKALSNLIFVSDYKEAPEFQFTRNDVSKNLKWTFKDALGNPIPNAHVKVYIHKDYKREFGILLNEGATDELGQLTAYSVRKGWQHVSFIVSHPDYGTALYTGLTGYLPMYQEDVHLPLVLAGSDEDMTSVLGIVVDPENKPLSGIKIKCKEIRTLDEGLITPLGGGDSYAVITDKDGKFRLYTPVSEQGKDERGEYIPPKSKFRLHVIMPKDAQYHSYEGWAYNDRENVIKLEKKDITEFTDVFKPSEEGSYRTFIFKDENGLEFIPEQQENIELYIHQKNKSKIEVGYHDWQEGGIFPDGVYKASFSKKRVRSGIKVIFNFKPVEVDQTSPSEVVFELSDPITYVGQVVDGITGLPMEGTFVMIMWGTGGRNLSWLTQQQWDALHKFGRNPDIDDPNLMPIHEKYLFKTIQRTDHEGKFSMKALPEDKIWGCVVFEENYLPAKLDAINRMNRMKKKIEVFDFGQINLFPAATVKLEVVVPEKHVSVMPGWKIDFKNSPDWAKQIKNVENRWLEENKLDSFYVPAGVSFKLNFRMPYDDQWTPLTIDKVFYLEPGEFVDVGKQHLQGSIWIYVKIIDPEDKPVEGVPIRLGQNVPHITDIEGRAKFYVPMHSKGKVGIMYYSHDNDNKLRKQIMYSVNGKEDTDKEYTIKLSERELQILFD